MATRKVLLKEDNTGLAPDNFIEDELQDVGTGSYRAFILEYGAFFTEGFILKDSNDNVISKTQYSFGDLYEMATRNSGKEVWNTILIHDVNVPRNLKVTYHAYGGKFARNARLLLDWVQEKIDEAVTPIDFMDLVDRPREYVPEFHLHLWKEVYGWKFIKQPLTHIENAIELDKSPFFDAIIKDIQFKLQEANTRALELARFYAEKTITDATSDISRETLGIHLLANLPIASEDEMTLIGRSDFNGESIAHDKYINKKGLVAFTKSLKNRSVNMQATGLGLPNALVRESSRGAILSLGNGAVATFKSKRELVNEGNYYEENVYPKNFPDTDRFTVVRVTNNIANHGGVFLGFNNTTGEMFSGVLQDDRCFMRIKWYKFYSDHTYDAIIVALDEHIKATNNPHKLTKKQVNLDKVANLPVVTVEQVLGDEPVDAYMTLDAVQLFMTKHMLNLKPEFNEDGSLKKDSDLFNKPNIIFTPCDKKVENNWPPKGQLLKTYCDGTDRFQRLADGNGGFTDEVLELNSDDCRYFEIKPQGEVLHKYCDQTNQMAVIADGRGGTSTILYSINSAECGYEEPPEAGTVISEGCVGKDYVKRFADGNGGVIENIVKVNSEDCGYIPPTTAPPVTTTTRAPGSGKSILFQTSTPNIEVGQPETMSASFSGFPPNTTVPFILYGKLVSWPPGMDQTRPDLEQYKQRYPALQDSVQIDSNGNGSWSYYQVDNGTVPRETSWEGTIEASDGTLSNTILRKFVGAGQGSGTTRPPLTTTLPPTSSTPTVTIEYSGTKYINNFNIRQYPPVVVRISGGNPNTNYYLQIFMQNKRNPNSQPWGTLEKLNGMISANYAGNGVYNTSMKDIFNDGNMMEPLGEGYLYAVLDNSVESNKIEITSSYVDTSGG